MQIVEIIGIAIGLSMDAFAVSVGKGLAVRKVRPSNALSVGLWFGGFQALMPLLGYFLGSAFAEKVCAIDHWIAFGLLFLIGANMIREAFSSKEAENDDFGLRTMLILALATSIDALAAGVSLSFIDVNIWLSIALIGATTFAFSVGGIYLGHTLGGRFHKWAEVFGGAILIAMGLKILLQHLFF